MRKANRKRARVERNIPQNNRSPFERETPGKFTTPEVASLELVRTVQDGMKDAFKLGRGEEKKNRIGEYMVYAAIALSYLVAIAITFWPPSDDRFSPEIKQQAIGYMWSIPTSLFAAFVGRSKD